MGTYIHPLHDSIDDFWKLSWTETEEYREGTKTVCEDMENYAADGWHNIWQESLG